ncbi:hypothetical protein VCHA51O444_20526 [Vibrio chagasii]|nr:hypothetical protein VCHA35P150_20554 [Vibrio chagasii]CAH7325754.1 hypothetical protein VCHA51O444_20526 [Vibrio chagasii]CAH7443347.1 hypothetical protein VCHA41O245_380007 [Vibrio chagasii]
MNAIKDLAVIDKETKRARQIVLFKFSIEEVTTNGLVLFKAWAMVIGTPHQLF